MSGKYFSVSRNQHGVIEAKLGSQTPTAEALALLQRILSADALVSDPQIIASETERASYREQLLSYAIVGLDYGDTATANAAMEWFELKVVDRNGPEVRRRHIVSTLGAAAAVGVPAAVATLLPFFQADANSEVVRRILEAALYLLVGNALGMIIFSFVRNLDLTFVQLRKLDPARLTPFLRLTLVACTTAVLAVLLETGILQFGVGTIPFNDFLIVNQDKTATVSPGICIAVGIFAGFADSKILATVTGVLKSGDTKSS